jgi:electron transfer flavoprotein alpha subunit
MILGLVDHDRGKLNDLTLEMLTLGRQLAARTNVPLQALLVGAEARPLAERLSAYGVAAVHLAQHERLNDYAPEAWAQSAVELISSANPEAVLAPGSERGNEVMAHIAARTGLPMAANCTEVQPGDAYVVTRLRWGGSLLEEARLRGSVKLMTVAPHAVAAEQTAAGDEPDLIAYTPNLADGDFRVRITSRIESSSGKVSLAEARAVVGGGRGVGSADGFRSLIELADRLGGAIGCSRAVTSLGWRPHSDQVGQTGTRIAPDIYIACGISGAIQHMIGCKSAKHILAINTDADAPIMLKAEYAVIGDVNKVVPAISAEIRRVTGT